MNCLRKATFTCLAILIAATLSPAAGDADGQEWIQLFNGKDMDGWTPKFKGHALGENDADTFRVEDGILKVCYDKYETFGNKFGHLFYEKPFSDYVLRAEYRFVGDQVPGGPGWAFRNNGLMLHGQSPESMDKAQSFPHSIEVQLLGGKSKGEMPQGGTISIQAESHPTEFRKIEVRLLP